VTDDHGTREGDAEETPTSGESTSTTTETATDDERDATRGPPREPERPSLTDDDRERLATLIGSAGDGDDRPGLLGLLVAAAGFVLGAGPIGIVAVVGTGLLWIWAAPLYAATGGAAVLAVLGIDGIPAAIAAAGLGVILLSPVGTLRRTDRLRALAPVLVAGAALGGVLWVALANTSLPLAAAALVSTVALGSYAIHRVSLVRVVYPSTGTLPTARPDTEPAAGTAARTESDGRDRTTQEPHDE
jgi:hypothetical protein